MPAVPFIPAIGSMVMGGISAARNAKRAGKADKMQQAGLGASMGVASKQEGLAGDLTGLAMPGLRQSSNYYSTLLNGNRNQMRLATAAPTAAITAQYRGAERGLEHAGVRGGERMTAMAELNRDRAATIAGQTTGVQPMAAAALGDLSGRTMNSGLASLNEAGATYQNAAGQYGDRHRTFSGNQRDDMTGVGRGLADLIAVWQRTRGGGSGGGFSSPFGANIPSSQV